LKLIFSIQRQGYNSLDLVLQIYEQKAKSWTALCWWS